MAINFLLMVDFSVLLLTFCFEKSTNVSGKFSALWYFFPDSYLQKYSVLKKTHEFSAIVLTGRNTGLVRPPVRPICALLTRKQRVMRQIQNTTNL